MENSKYWSSLKNKHRIVIKVGSSSLIHLESGTLDYLKIERLVRTISDIKSMRKEVILVSSGAVAVGRREIGITKRPLNLAEKQACASVGQSSLMTTYRKVFSEYNEKAAQILLSKLELRAPNSCTNAKNTIKALLELGVIPIANENDTVSPVEIEFGDNDTLSAIVAVIADADLLILLTDTEGLYTDNPNLHKDAKLISVVKNQDVKIYGMAKDTNNDVGTGGMYTKVKASEIVNNAGIDMVIASGKKPDIIYDILNGEESGTLFVSHQKDNFKIRKYINDEEVVK